MNKNKACNTTDNKKINSFSEYTFNLELSFPIESFCHATVVIPKKMINQLYTEVSLGQKQAAQTHGFAKGDVPLEYIQKNFKESIREHLKEFLFKYCVVNFLYNEMRTKKISLAGEPRLVDITLAPDQDARFHFEFFKFPEIDIHEWKYFPFRAPKRKNYKDLDRQVEAFVKHEIENLEQHSNDTLCVGDFVNFNLSIDTQDNQQLLKNFTQNFWFKLGNEEIESPLRDLFIGRKKGEIFHSKDMALQECFSGQLETNYNFCIEIVDTLAQTFFCFDLLKKHFRIKTNKDLHKKLIEVFSYRNDLSQRRSIVEESLRLQLTKHPFTVPRHLILRQEKVLRGAVQQNPDYNVYRMQKDFETNIRKLAEKQAREEVFMDQFAYHENIEISHEDVKSYLNLLNRPRTKEFIYFKTPSSTIHGQEVPVATEEIKRVGLREKAINHIIYHLTKK